MTSTATLSPAAEAFLAIRDEDLLPGLPAQCIAGCGGFVTDPVCARCGGLGLDPIVRRGVTGAVSENALPERGTGTARTSAPTMPAKATFGWTKYEGAWCALAPVGTKVEAGEVTLVTKAGKETKVYLTGKVLAKLKFGTVCEFTDAPKATAPAAPAESAQDARPAAPKSAAVQLDLTGLVSGFYAVPEGTTRLKVKVDVVTEGKWAGYVFVRNGAEYGPSAGQRLGSQRPGGFYSGQATSAIEAILADPAEAMAAYGRLTGTCGACSRHLEDQASIDRGMGPVCARKWS